MSGQMNEARAGDTLYDSDYRPDLASARDVLAFVLTPATVFVGQVPPEEMWHAERMLYEAKSEACRTWRRLNPAR